LTEQQNEKTNSVESIGVLVCTYRRPGNLSRCLSGLEKQIRQPNEVLVVVRDDDVETLEYLRNREPDTLPIRIQTVQEPGLVAARTAGVAACTTDVLAITDDDAVPHPDWLDRILAHFKRDPSLGGVGGRDQCFVNGLPQPASMDLVGKLLWNGKYVGNHHLGRGSARKVDIIKGANMSYRGSIFSTVHFDERLRGKGSQPCEDLAFSRAVACAGWTLIYDPAVLVDHYEGPRDEPRHYAAQVVSDPTGFKDSVYNQVVALWSSMSPPRRLLSLLYFFVVGTRASPGLLQAVRFTPSLGRASWVRFWLAIKARLEAYKNLSREAVSPGARQARAS
jgi:GT2 family glycosyltransferase